MFCTGAVSRFAEILLFLRSYARTEMLIFFMRYACISGMEWYIYHNSN